MDAQDAALAGTVATTLATLMAQDAWGVAKAALKSAFGVSNGTDIDPILGELDRKNTELSEPTADVERTTAEMRTLLLQLAQNDSQALPNFFEALNPIVQGRVSMKAKAKGRGTVIQQGSGTQINR